MIFLASVIVIFVDFFYLNLMTPFYSKLVLDVQKSPMTFDILSAFLCYITLIFGLYYFILKDRKPVLDAFILGLVIYGVFEFTNKAIFRNWSWASVVIDTLWGGTLFGITTYLVYKIKG